MRGDRQLIFIPIVALVAVSPLILKGPSCGHDFEFHMRNWLEVSSQWKQGVILPHWDFTAAWNSGEPRFVFYPPVSWSIGALLGLMLPWGAVPTTFIFLALLGCGLTMYRLTCEWTSSSNALIAAAFYMVQPYMLFTFYERAAYAELLAAAWIPLLILGVLRPRLTIAGIAIPICLLWLTNDPAAVMGSYALGLLGVTRVAYAYRNTRDSRRALREAINIGAGGTLGIGLAGFYVLPATIEQHWVQINMPFLRGVRYQDNFSFGSIGDPSHDVILRTASLCGVALLVVAGVSFAVAFRSLSGDRKISSVQNSEQKLSLFALAVLACFSAFLLTSASAVLWRHLPELRFLQFPWRFCAILGATTAALLALAISRSSPRPAVAMVIACALTLSFTLGGNRLFRQACYPNVSTQGQVAGFYHGGEYDPTDEYTPVGSEALAVQHSNPASWIADRPADPAPETGADDYSVALARRLHFDVSSLVPRFLVVSLRDYPAWKISVNGAPVANLPHRPDGLIVIPIPSGRSKIDIAYSHTPDQVAGWIITALSVALLFFVARKMEGSR